MPAYPDVLFYWWRKNILFIMYEKKTYFDLCSYNIFCFLWLQEYSIKILLFAYYTRCVDTSSNWNSLVIWDTVYQAVSYRRTNKGRGNDTEMYLFKYPLIPQVLP